MGEPQSVLIQHACTEEICSAWREGGLIEHLYWKHATRSTGMGAHAVHGLHLLADFLGAIPRPRRMLELLGRTAAYAGLLLHDQVRDEGQKPHLKAAEPDPVPDHHRRRDAGSLLSDRERRLAAPRKAIQSF
jgi:hypothetical protein